MKVLVLGHKGMLGHMVSKFLIYKGAEVITTDCRWPTSCFKNTTQNFDGDYIVNCVGAIHQRTNQSKHEDSKLQRASIPASYSYLVFYI